VAIFEECENTCVGVGTGTGTGFCEDFEQNLRTFFCGSPPQTIRCEVANIPFLESQNTPIISNLINIAESTNDILLQCVNVDTILQEAVGINGSLDLNCLVFQTTLQDSPQVCQTLQNQCLENNGVFECRDNFATAQTFCTTKFEEPTETPCDCNMHWTESEGIGMVPSALQELTCVSRGLQTAVDFYGSVTLFETDPTKQFWCFDQEQSICSTRPGTQLTLGTSACLLCESCCLLFEPNVHIE
jgi:hypothetical protein